MGRQSATVIGLRSLSAHYLIGHIPEHNTIVKNETAKIPVAPETISPRTARASDSSLNSLRPRRGSGCSLDKWAEAVAAEARVVHVTRKAPVVGMRMLALRPSDAMRQCTM
jgi:hypothetical protein